MRISDWSSDVCSSDRYGFHPVPALEPGCSGNLRQYIAAKGRCSGRRLHGVDGQVDRDSVHVGSHASASAGSPAGIAVGSIHITSQIWPSGSSKLRPYMKPKSCVGVGSALPPALTALSTCPSTSSRSAEH